MAVGADTAADLGRWGAEDPPEGGREVAVMCKARLDGYVGDMSVWIEELVDRAPQPESREVVVDRRTCGVPKDPAQVRWRRERGECDVLQTELLVGVEVEPSTGPVHHLSVILRGWCGGALWR
jgi:hypothetical protein